MGNYSMQSRLRRVAMTAALFGGGGFLLATTSTGCLSFAAKSIALSTDFCFIFDCQNGILGGTIDPCSGIGSGDNTVEAGLARPVFTDCPNADGP